MPDPTNKPLPPTEELARRKHLLAEKEKRVAELRRAYEFSAKNGAVEKFLLSISIADRRLVVQASNRSDQSSRVAMTQAEYQEYVRQYEGSGAQWNGKPS